MEGLLQWVVERVMKFPREHRFTVGDRLIETCPSMPRSGRRGAAERAQARRESRMDHVGLLEQQIVEGRQGAVERMNKRRASGPLSGASDGADQSAPT